MSINDQLLQADLQARVALIVYLKSPRDQVKLRKFGNIIYFSKKMNYCVLYVLKEKADKTKRSLLSLPYVEHVTDSANDQLEFGREELEQQIAEMALQANQKLDDDKEYQL